MARRPDGEIQDVRQKFERQCLAALAANPSISRGELVRRFGEGIGRGTGFRWIAELLGDGAPEKAEETATPAAPAAPPPPVATAATPPPPAAPPAPADPAPDALEGEVLAPTAPAGSDTTIRATAELADCLAIARQLVDHARDENGRPRNVRLLLAASEHRRRVIETAARVQATLLEHGKLDEWNSALFAEIQKSDPESHRRICEAMRRHLDTTPVKSGGRII
jgi:hypothetical protein